MSRRRYCEPCGEAIRLDNYRQLRAHAGPYFQAWREGMVAAVGGHLDEPRPAA